MVVFLKILFVSAVVVLIYLVVGIILSTKQRRKKWTDNLIRKLARTSLLKEGKVLTDENMSERIRQLEKYREHFEKKVDVYLSVSWLPLLLTTSRRQSKAE